MKKLILGLLGAVAVTLPVQAQEFIYPTRNTCDNIIEYMCLVDPEEGSDYIYAIPAFGEGRYMIIMEPVDQYNRVTVYNINTRTRLVYILYTDEGRIIREHNGVVANGGTISVMGNFIPEVAQMLLDKPW